MTTVKVFLSIAAKKNWILCQLDVHNAFLNGDLEEDIYMKIPQGLLIQGEYAEEDRNQLVCKLHKSLYGLKQASRQWNSKLTIFLKSIGFIQSKSDYSLFTKSSSSSNKDDFIALLVYVDDIIIGSNDQTQIDLIKESLKHHFKIRDIGNFRYFLGLEVARSDSGIHVSQKKYTSEIIDAAGLLGCKPTVTPIEQNTKYLPNNSEP